MMYKAMQSSETLDVDEENSQMMDFNVSSKLHNLKTARTLATEITESGAKLFDLLAQERDLKQSRENALEFLDSISRNLDTNTEQQYIEKCIRNIIDQQTKKKSEMEDTVKQLRLDEGELSNKIQRRKQELERAEKRLKGIENVKPEYQEEYERLEAELERFYTIYVEKFTNIDYLEYELDMYNLKDTQRRAKQEQVISKLIDQHKRQEKDEIFNDDDDVQKDDMYGQMQQNNMRETKTNFGANVHRGYGNNQMQQEGGLQHDDESDDEDIGDEDDEDEGDEGIDQDEDDDDKSNHDF
jgi:clusterin-associated protein 1